MFRLEEFMGRRVLRSSLMDYPDIDAFFTTRDLPLKCGERTDLLSVIEANKKLVCKGFEIAEENLLIPHQTHSDNVKVIKSQSDLTMSLENTDALVTNLKNVALALNFADCVPIILFDSKKKVIGAVHAGWRGTAAKIGVKTFNKMQSEFGSNPKDIIALIGPAIGKCCFEVGDDVAAKIKSSVDNLNADAFASEAKLPLSGKNNIDLKLINKSQLLAIGIEKIDLCEDCTSCKNELFFSYRKENANTQRHSAVIIMKEPQ